MPRFLVLLLGAYLMSSCSAVSNQDATDTSGGVDVNNEMVYFQCSEKDGNWTLTTKVKNPTENSVDYTLDVFISAPGIESPVASYELAGISPGESQEFEFSGIKAASPQAQCWARLRR